MITSSYCRHGSQVRVDGQPLFNYKFKIHTTYYQPPQLHVVTSNCTVYNLGVGGLKLIWSFLCGQPYPMSSYDLSNSGSAMVRISLPAGNLLTKYCTPEGICAGGNNPTTKTHVLQHGTQATSGQSVKKKNTFRDTVTNVASLVCHDIIKNLSPCCTMVWGETIYFYSFMML